MFPYISREDCYYTDTDSIVIKSPLPDEDVSSTVLGKFKLEKNIPKGIFLAPKAYYVYPSEGEEEIIKHKGAGKAMADREWYESVLDDPELKRTYTYEKEFHRNWGELLVQYKEFHITMSLNSKKRVHIHNSEGRLVGTKPYHVTTEMLIKHLGQTPLRAISQILDENEQLKRELDNLQSGRVEAEPAKEIDTTPGELNNNSGEGKP